MIVSPVSTLALLPTCDQIRVDVEKSYAHGFHECVFDGEQLLWASNADWSLMRRLETRQQPMNLIVLTTPRRSRCDYEMPV
jgi:hypothetical protein